MTSNLNYIVGIIGNPVQCDVEWSDENLLEMKRLGFNVLQLNIAWGYRPCDEPLNLEDVLLTNSTEEYQKSRVILRRSKMISRLQQCRKHGFRSLFHFGAPFNGENGYIGLPLNNCISDKDLVKHYVELIHQLNEQIPGIDDILIYTYDQDAWLCSEFSGCKHCFGIPLHQRLPEFINALAKAWEQVNPQGKLWWEPWELSSGQVFETVKRLSATNIGLSLHSNIGEVQKTQPGDMWLKNTARLAQERKIPVIAELFLGQSSEETEPLRRVPVPRLTYNQISAVRNISGITGIKEYYGVIPNDGDPCLEVMNWMLREPEKHLDKILAEVASPYGPANTKVVAMWELAAQGYEVFPWDVSWYAREIGRAKIDHGWNAAFIRGQQCSTPSWDSSRHSVFMKTDDSQPHQWMIEDIQLRCAWAAELLEKATAQCLLAMEVIPGESKEGYYLGESLSSLTHFSKVCRSYELHLRETNLASMIRINRGKCDMIVEPLIKELRDLICRDIANQNGNIDVVKMLKKFDEDPSAWLDCYLVEPAKESENNLVSGRVDAVMLNNAFTLTTR